MSPTPIVKHETSQYDDPRDKAIWCQDCQRHHWEGLGHACDPLAPARGILVGLAIMLITTLMVLGLLWIAFSPNSARANQLHAPKPIPAPQALLRARHACPNTASIVQCRSALRRAYAAVEWQRAQNYPGDASAAITLACHREHTTCAGFFAVAQCESNMHPLDQLGQYKGLFQLGATHRSDPIIRMLGWDDPYASALHTVRFVKAHGWGQWQCMPSGGLRW